MSQISTSSENERKHLLSSPVPMRTSSEPLPSKATQDTASEIDCPERVSRCNYVPLEFVVFVYFFARAIPILLTTFYFFDTASHWYGDPSMDSLNPCGKGTAEHKDEDKARRVKQEAVQLDVMAAFTGYLPAVIPTILLGPMTDRFGRRWGFVLPILGTLCRCAVFLLVIGIEGVSPYFMYLGIALEGLGGNFGAMLMTSFSAVADVTPVGPKRAFRISVVEAVQVIATSAATLATGFWRKVGYGQPLILCGVLSLLCLVYTLWWLPETRHYSGQGDSVTVRGHFKDRIQPESQENGSAGGEPASHSLHSGQIQVRHTYPAISIHEAASTVCHAGLDPGHGQITSAEDLLSFRNERGESQACSVPSRRHEGAMHSADRCGGAAGPGESRTLTQGQKGEEAEEGRCGDGCAHLLEMVRKCVRVYRRVDTHHPARRCILALCMAAFLLTVAVNFTKPGVEEVYRMSDLCWNAVKNSIYTSCWLIAHWVCILVTLRVLQRCLHVHDVYVAMIGCISGIAAVVVMAFAKNDVLVQLSAAAGTFGRALIPMLRSISSASVEVDEQGTLFAGYACVELAGAAVFNIAVGKLYNTVAPIWNGIIFIIFAAVLCIVLLLLVLLAYRIKREHGVTMNARKTYRTFENE